LLRREKYAFGGEDEIRAFNRRVFENSERTREIAEVF
jgi:hypothetical protein